MEPNEILKEVLVKTGNRYLQSGSTDYYFFTCSMHILVEQTIGRGLRLPYEGKRTGVDKIDKLTVVAHENFDAVILAAKDPNSVLNKMSFVEIAVFVFGALRPINHLR